MSLFDKKQKMRKPDKATLAKFLRAFVEPVEQPPCLSLVIDGTWLLHNVKWEANLTWRDIVENYLQFVKAMGSQHVRIIVVSDGYINSTKDHEHIRRTKHVCCDIQIRPDIKSIIPREKFLDNKSNKARLIRLLAETGFRIFSFLSKRDISVGVNSNSRASLVLTSSSQMMMRRLKSLSESIISFSPLTFGPDLRVANDLTLYLVQ